MADRMRHEQASPAVQKRVQDSFDLQGLMSHLGAWINHIGPGRVHIVLPARPAVTQQHGYIHAGAVSAVADSAGGCAALTLFDEESEVLTVEYEINLLAPAADDHLEAIGTVLKPGRTLTVCRLEANGLQTDGVRELVANGQQALIRVNRTAG
ncbi:PaaI family thioesterase [Streptomyces sp. NPDC000927]|uniref:PaaI family thioesterase n=2 Tax=unclassified Streptomyces TaxID=2593676 RepID=UPI0033210CB8